MKQAEIHPNIVLIRLFPGKIAVAKDTGRRCLPRYKVARVGAKVVVARIQQIKPGPITYAVIAGNAIAGPKL